MKEIFRTKPIIYIDKIPMFSNLNDKYIKNDKKISLTHLKAMDSGINKTFIDNELRGETENSTLELIEIKVICRKK
ncbi:MAG: hypothetical protein NC918_06630 [Candidatus Omnitrophica bacterium]|nr:hypothetical protein [Candidatus Omnitrophota bacterium]